MPYRKKYICFTEIKSILHTYMQIKFIKEIEILSSLYTITWDKTSNGGSFCCGKSEIEIGIKSYKKDPSNTMQVLSHEIMEIILVVMGARFDHSRIGGNYLFSFDHQTFENAIKIHTQTMSKFIQ